MRTIVIYVHGKGGSAAEQMRFLDAWLTAGARSARKMTQ